MLYPLSPSDRVGVEQISSTLAFIIDRSANGTSDVGNVTLRVDQAMRRVVEKWRMLSGNSSSSSQLWAIRVPDDEVLPESYITHAFTTSISDNAYSIPELTPSTAVSFNRPPVALFRSPLTPVNNVASAKKQAPLLAVHITTLSKHPDIIFLGIALPHTLTDGTGFGMIVNALDCELRGDEWKVPPLPNEGDPNPFVLVVGEAVKAHGSESETMEQLAARFWRDFEVDSWWGRIRYIAGLFWERYWHRAESRNVFLGEEVVRRLVEPVKREVRDITGGEEYVSTGDVLLSWVLKSAYAGDTSEKILGHSSVFNLRSVHSSLEAYPHNALAIFNLPYLSTTSLQITPLSMLSLLHRRSLLAVRPWDTLLLLSSRLDRSTGESSSMVYIRGPSVRFYVVPDMLAQAPMFKRVGPNAMKGRGIGTARGRATIMRAQSRRGRGGPADRGAGRGIRR
ncbi:hypothetical protein P7C70_g5384, partial [Phenoliferia sp. Uapishka_3]